MYGTKDGITEEGAMTQSQLQVQELFIKWQDRTLSPEELQRLKALLRTKKGRENWFAEFDFLTQIKETGLSDNCATENYLHREQCVEDEDLIASQINFGLPNPCRHPDP